MLLYQSNRLEILAAQLCTLLAEDPAPPLSPEVVVVQHQGMAQWLQLHIADHQDIAAHIHFPLPARFMGETGAIFSGERSRTDLFDQPILHWRVLDSLPVIAGMPGCEEPAGYLHDGNPVKAYQLAGTISSLFDKYLVFRPDMIKAWEAGEGEHWQAVLWRLLTDKDSDMPHRADLALELLEQLAAFDAPPAGLPKRCFLFGVNTMAPVYLEILNRMSAFMEVHLFHLSPCREYWGDLLSQKDLARRHKLDRNRNRRTSDSYIETGNPLLSSWGTVGRDFHNQLLDYDLHELSLHRSTGSASLLCCLQEHILDNLDGTERQTHPSAPLPVDESLQFHIAHSPLREVQVLHDSLLSMFERMPDLTAGDILVTAPDIGLYADSVRTVFNSASDEMQIPYYLADRPTGSESVTVRAYMDLLALYSGRFSALEVLDLLETEAVLQRFNLPRAALSELRHWVEDTAIRWGIDGEQTVADDLSPCAQTSWRAGMDKLLLGYFLGDSQTPVAGLFPHQYGASAEPELLGNFLTLIEQLTFRYDDMGKSHSPEKWAELLHDLLHAFFDEESDENGFRIIADAIYDFSEHTAAAGFIAPLTAQTVRRHLSAGLSAGTPDRVFLTGRVTFCNMVPMRAVPFRVICVLGMRDGAFPRSQQPPSFDMTAQAPRIGDRNRRQDDRYLFLEILASARDTLYISWPGRNQRDNTLTPPSIVVSELQDYLDACFRHHGEGSCSELTSEHPLQPFSPQAFSAGTNSYAGQWLPSVEKLPREAFFEPGPAPPAPRLQQVDTARLAAFWRQPAGYFLTNTMGLQLRSREQIIETTEPFSLDHLEQYLLRRETVRALITNQEHAHDQRLQASGLIPQAGFGAALMEDVSHFAGELSGRLRQWTGTPQEPLEIDLNIAGRRLSGRLTELYSEGRVTWRTGSVKGSVLMELWVHHLLLNLAAPENVIPQSIHCCRDQTLTLLPVTDPADHLLELVELFEQGQVSPLPFFPETCLAWNRAKPENRMRDARKRWIGDDWSRGECLDDAYQLLYPEPGIEQLDRSFERLADLFIPLLEHLNSEDAGS